jgi:type II secretory pathway predicted ATPase ExeA
MNGQVPLILQRLEDEQFFFEAPGQLEALARLDFSWEHRLPFALLRGGSGSGKTTVLRRFQLALRKEPIQAVFVNATGSTAEELTWRLAWELGLSLASGGRGRVWIELARRFEELAYNRTPLVLLCDDLHLAADNLTPWLTRMWNALPSGALPITVVAAVDDGATASLPIQLAERVDLRIDLEPWQVEDLCGLIAALTNEHSDKLFDAAALERLLTLSGGNARQVRQLVRMSLLACLGCDETTVNEATLLSVSEELCGFAPEATQRESVYHVAYA